MITALRYKCFCKEKSDQPLSIFPAQEEQKGASFAGEKLSKRENFVRKYCNL